MRHVRYFFIVALCALGSCSGDTAPRTLDGRWVAVDEPPGFALHLILTTSDNAVSGTGDWQGEAIVGGTVTVMGELAHGDVILNLGFTHGFNSGTQPPDFVERFAATFKSRDDLEGTTTLDGQQSALHLHRLLGP